MNIINSMNTMSEVINIYVVYIYTIYIYIYVYILEKSRYPGNWLSSLWPKNDAKHQKTKQKHEKQHKN